MARDRGVFFKIPFIMLLICQLNLIIFNGFEKTQSTIIYSSKLNFVVESPPKMMKTVHWTQNWRKIFFSFWHRWREAPQMGQERATHINLTVFRLRVLCTSYFIGYPFSLYVRNLVSGLFEKLDFLDLKTEICSQILKAYRIRELGAQNRSFLATNLS